MRAELLRFRENVTAELRVRPVDDATFDRLTKVGKPGKKTPVRVTSSLPPLRT
jgi:hypothetical protein